MENNVNKLSWEKYIPLKYTTNFKVKKNNSKPKGVNCDKFGTPGFYVERFYKEISQIVKL